MIQMREGDEINPETRSTRSINVSSENLWSHNNDINPSIPSNLNPISHRVPSTSESFQHRSPPSSSSKRTSKPTFFGVDNTDVISFGNKSVMNADIPADEDDEIIIEKESDRENERRNNLIEQQFSHSSQPGFLRRTLQSICGQKREHSPKKRKPRGKGKKTKYAISRTKNALQNQTLDSMDENQTLFYNAAIERASTAEEQLKAEQSENAPLRQQNKILQDELASANANNENLLERIALLEAEKSENAKRREKDAQKIQLLEAENRELKIQSMGVPQLRKGYASVAQLNRQLNDAVQKMQKDHSDLEQFTSELQQLFNAMEECTKVALEKPTVSSQTPKASGRSFIPKAFEEYQPRTQRHYVAKIVNDLNEEPLLKEKILARLVPKVDEKKQKMTTLQALAAAVLLDFNQNQIEKLKTLLRLLKIDVLPPIPTIRTLIKNIRREYQYEYFQDEEQKIYVRVITSIKELIKIRTERWLETEKFVHIPGFENCVFYGIGSDQGGRSKKYVLNLMNVPIGHASPNNSAVFGVSMAPKDNYETTKYCIQKKFDEIDELDGTEMEFNVHGTVQKMRVFFIVSVDGKEGSILSGHCGASSSNPCPTCECTKDEINEGRSSPLRDSVRMMEQAERFQRKKEGITKPTAKQLTELRKEATCIVHPPICKIDKKQWIYGELHAVGGPVFGVLQELEDKALKADLEELKITVLQKKDVRKLCTQLQKEITLIKSYIIELEKAVKMATTVKPKWLRLSKHPSQKSDNDCWAKYCVMNVLRDKSTQSLYFKCSNCNKFVHGTCDLLFISYELQYAEEVEYLCPECEPISDDVSLKDLDSRIEEWQKDAAELKIIMAEKEKEKSEASENTVIPWDQCIRYQKIEEKLRELKIRKSCHPFQGLKGVDVRKLVTNADSFIEALEPEWQEPTKTFLDCMNVYQELAEPITLTAEDIARIDKEAVLRSYRQICGSDIPLKVHDLTTHTPEFMKTWGFYQLASDQPVEHVHYIDMKLKMRNPQSKRSPQVELEAFTNAMSIRNKLFDLGISAGNFDGRLIEEKRKMFEALTDDSST